MNTSFEYQKLEIEKQAKKSGLNIFFVGYSEANGLSVYFKDENGSKYRFSNHGISNPERIATEKTFPLPFVKMFGLGGKISEKHNNLFA